MLQSLEDVADGQGSWEHEEDFEGLEDNEDTKGAVVGNSKKSPKRDARGPPGRNSKIC